MKYCIWGGIIAVIIYIICRIIGFYFSSNEFFHDSNLLITSVVGIFFFLVGSSVGWITSKIKAKK